MNHFSFNTSRLLILSLFFSSCLNADKKGSENYGADIKLSKAAYLDKLEGFWLGQCIANWTGLITEMDKIGNIGEIKTGDFYTRDDWGKPDHPSIWGEGIPSAISPTIDFVFADEDSIWGADDDTDIEFMYQYKMFKERAPMLSAKQISEAWLHHIKKEEENYLWVSNQKAFDLMNIGYLPPQTSEPELNEHYEMIDAQLTTEIFGLYSPGRPDVALKLSELPILTTARENAKWISEFNVIMYSLAAGINKSELNKESVLEMAAIARMQLPDTSYSAKMFDFVKSNYLKNIPWEKTRDQLYQKYQVNQEDGYTITSRNLYCNGCFAAGINFGASIISLLYGEGNLIETIKIGALCGWDSDNPTATWGGLIGFVNGKHKIEQLFNRKFSEKYNIHRTRVNFEQNGIYTFQQMAEMGLAITENVVLNELDGKLDEKGNYWSIPMQKFQEGSSTN